MLDDAALLRRYAEEKSEAAFAELVARHLGVVYAAALRQLGDAEHRAQDVAQSVFVDLARNAVSLSRRTEIVGWLYTSTRYAAAKLKRTEQRREHREQEAHAMNEMPSSYEEPTADWDRLRPVLDDAMHGLSESDRTAILLRYFQGRRFAEVGEQLGLSEDAARMRVERALEKLRASLAHRGITSTGVALASALASPALAAVPSSMAPLVTTAALAGANSAGVATAAATFFMNKSTWVATGVALAAIGFGLYEIRQNRELTTTTTAVEAELAIARKQLSDAERRATTAAQLNLTLRAAQNAPRSTLSQPAFSLSKNTPASQQGIMFLGSASPNDPASFAQQAAQTQSAVFDNMYALLYRELGFTSEQRERFTALIVSWKEHGNELFGAAINEGIKPTSDLVRQIFDKTNPERDAKIRADFGDATWQAFQRFEMRAPLRSATTQLATELFRSETPLSPVQADQLVNIMVANTPTTPDGKMDFLAMDRDTVVIQAQSVLSPGQLPALQRELQGFYLNQKMQRDRAAKAAIDSAAK